MKHNGKLGILCVSCLVWLNGCITYYETNDPKLIGFYQPHTSGERTYATISIPKLSNVKNVVGKFECGAGSGFVLSRKVRHLTNDILIFKDVDITKVYEAITLGFMIDNVRYYYWVGLNRFESKSIKPYTKESIFRK